MAREGPGHSSFVRSEGGLLPWSMLLRIADGDPDLEGTGAESFHLLAGERLPEAINRSWNKMKGAWTAFRQDLSRLEDGEPATKLTRECWLLPLFSELGYGRLGPSPEMLIADKEYPVFCVWRSAPIHLVGAGASLDKRTRGAEGAERQSPQSMVQELLNRSSEHLWGLVSNGRVLRVLRDNSSLTRSAFVEFDLESIMEAGAFSDFALAWMLCHESRVEGEPPTDCVLEHWFRTARSEGSRALDKLRDGVEEAIKALGAGFLASPSNRGLREALRSGALPVPDYYRELLRLVYRMMLLMVAEDRALLHSATADAEAVERYERHYSMRRLRGLAELRRGDRHHDLYESLKVVMACLGGSSGGRRLGLPVLNGFLFSDESAMPRLARAELPNSYLLAAVRHLGYMESARALTRIDYSHLGVEELGAVYESLLELHPELDSDAAGFSLTMRAGSERKTTGSYYTPAELVERLLDSALDPVLEEARASRRPEEAILSLRVVDPACGSGHFLVAAARRMANALAHLRVPGEEPSLGESQRALREVIGHCIYGVDANPMAVELAKVSLWMESLQPGKPLGFLDHHIVVGNSLCGTTPRLVSEGVPAAAFKELKGDDNAVCKAWRQQNAEELHGIQRLELGTSKDVIAEAIEHEAAALEALADDTPEALAQKQLQFDKLQYGSEMERRRLQADAWCAAFVAKKERGAPAITTGLVRAAGQSDQSELDRAAVEEIERASEEFGLLHWHLVFPDVLRAPQPGEEPANPEAGWSGGFDVVLGNPPWERVKLSEKEFFASSHPEIAAAAGARRMRLIAGLARPVEEGGDPPAFEAYQSALRHAEGESHLLRNSGRYPLCGRGDVNTYAVFAEAMRSLLSPRGRAGMVVPTGIATDDTTKAFFADLVDSGSLVSLYDFENRQGLFPGVHSSYKFSLLTMAGRGRPAERSEFAFFCHRSEALDDPGRRFRLSPEEISLINPNTKTCPTFRSRRDAELTLDIYRRVPVLVREGEAGGNLWGVKLTRMFDMTNDSGLFRTAAQCEAEGGVLDGNVYRAPDGRVWLPLYEGKMVHHFDHRWASAGPQGFGDVPAERKEDLGFVSQPRYWCEDADVAKRLEGWRRGWLLAFRGIARATDERTVIASFIPRTAVGNNLPLLLTDLLASTVACLGASLSSFALDYVARQKVGGTNLNFFIVKQLPVPPPEVFEKPAPWAPDITISEWIRPRVLELAYTAWDMSPVARDLRYEGSPFQWDEERRGVLRAELDACFFHLYGFERSDVEYVMESFPIVQGNDEAAYGEYRTKRLIFEAYDAMAEVAGRKRQATGA